MNGYVLAWMFLSSVATGVPIAAGAVLYGRTSEGRTAYRRGFDAGKTWQKYQQEEKGPTQALTDAQIAEWQRLMAGGPVSKPPSVGPHGHDGECTHERGCW